MAKGFYVALTILFLSAGLAEGPRAQGTPPPPPSSGWKSKMFFGGGVGMGFGDVDFVSVEPLVGIHLHPKVSVGASFLYRFTSDDRFDESIHTNDYGARAFAQYFPVPNFFGEVEYEYLDYEYVLPNLDTDRNTAGSVFVGGGISQPLGRNASFYASTLYNLSYDDNDPLRPYDSPWVVRVGVAAGF
jgi:hypothetical protein